MACNSGGDGDDQSGELGEHRAGDKASQLVAIIRTDIAPLLEPQPLITKAEREVILGYDPRTGV
jgi:antitoxin VapB